MFKLTVVAGPNRGSSFAVQNGHVTIGRQVGNVIQLESAQVSKRHCFLVVDQGKIELHDEGSINGTYVNGALAKVRLLKRGDRIGVGEFVLELVDSSPPRSDYKELAQVIPFPGQNFALAEPSPLSAAQDGQNKWMQAFDQNVMPYFYELNFKHEWRSLLAVLFFVMVVGNALIAVPPLLQNTHKTAIREIGRRAQSIALHIAEKNVGFIANKTESRAEIGTVDREDGVRLAVLTDLEGRILAPSERAGQLLAVGPEARFSAKVRNSFKQGRESGLTAELEDDLVVAVEPLKVYSPELARNVIVATAVVSIDSHLSTLNWGDIGIVYSQTVIFTSLLAMALGLILYRLSLRPFQVLNDEMDRVLKGELSQVTHEFKISELSALWDVINSALKRIGTEQGSFHETSSVAIAQESMAAFRMLGDLTRLGIMLVDSERKVVDINSQFEDISGIRADNAVGQTVGSVARDQAFIVLTNELFERATPGGPSVTEDTEFGGVLYQMHAVALGSSANGHQGYLLVAVKREE